MTTLQTILFVLCVFGGMCLGFYVGFNHGTLYAANKLKQFFDIFNNRIKARIGNDEFNQLYSQSLLNFEKQLKQKEQ